MGDATCSGQCLYKGDAKHNECASSCFHWLQGLQKAEGNKVEELSEVVGRRGSVGGGGWWSRLYRVRERTGGPPLTEGGSVPWALESLAGSLHEKFPEFAVMEIVYTRSIGQGEGESQICRSVRDGKKCLGKQKG